MNRAPDSMEPEEVAGPHLVDIGLDAFPPYLMNRIMGRYNAELRSEMAKLGLTTPKMRTIAVLRLHDGIPATRLAVLAVIEQSTLSRALDGMVAEGLVRREADPSDNRAARLYLTDAGRAAFDALWPRMSSETEAMFRGIPPEERAAFVRTLHRMLDNVRIHPF